MHVFPRFILAAGSAAIFSCCTTISTPSASPERIAGSSWHVAGLNAGGVQTRQMTIRFEEGGQVEGSSACNDFRATYEMDGRQLRFGRTVVLTTDRVCDLDTIETERRFIATLGQVRNASIAPSGSLVLNGPLNYRIVARPL